jgi:dinuclear metal center YbgI/SA1388 family protein
MYFAVNRLAVNKKQHLKLRFIHLQTMNMHTIEEITDVLENIAHPTLQEIYDNSGLLVGSKKQIVTGVLISLDCTEDVIDEAVANKCNLIVCHHPIIFTGLKRLTGNNYVERTVIKAIQHNIAVYAIHTNLDNILFQGVNEKIAQLIGLKHLNILQPKTGYLKKLVTFVPKDYLPRVEHAIYKAGAGKIGNYSECGFSAEGLGSFKPNQKAKPFLGKAGERHYEKEVKIESIFETWNEQKIIDALLEAHPYEEVAYDIINLSNKYNLIGSGIIGEFDEPIDNEEFLKLLKTNMDLPVIKYTKSNKKTVKKVAICGGSGSFLTKSAIVQNADAFVSSDFKYHDFFDAEEKLMICDIGHYESEKFTKMLLNEIIVKNFTTFAVILSEINTNPVNYYI